MLNRIGNTASNLCPSTMQECVSDKYKRNELDDMKKGIEYLYEFKEKLSNLHPVVLDAIENMLQRPRY